MKFQMPLTMYQIHVKTTRPRECTFPIHGTLANFFSVMFSEECL